MMIFDKIENGAKQGVKQLALLIDPDKVSFKTIDSIINIAIESKVDFLFFGGSYLEKSGFEQAIKYLKQNAPIPLVLFPGNSIQVSNYADAILFLSLVSGRNPDFLIGQQVTAAPFIDTSKIEVIPTAYLLIDGGKLTTAHYVSHTLPLPHDKPMLAVNTALAAKYMGMKMIYCDAGSGALWPVSTQIISKVKSIVNLPLIVGGGIKNGEQAQKALSAGADVLVIGNAAEKNPAMLIEIAESVKSFS